MCGYLCGCGKTAVKKGDPPVRIKWRGVRFRTGGQAAEGICLVQGLSNRTESVSKIKPINPMLGFHHQIISNTL